MTLFIIWLIGCAVAYFGQKKFVHDGQTWSRQDRATALCLSVFSWVGIIVAVGAFFVCKNVSDKPAKW